jgi:hypothetical protein
MTLETITAFFGWCTIINMGVLLVSTLAILLFRGYVTQKHAQWFHLDEQAVNLAYFQYLAQYKIVTLALNLAPYCALKILASSAS